FLCCRAFRQTLLCHASATINRNLDPARLEGLYLTSIAKPVEADASPSNRAPMVFRAPGVGELKTQRPLIKATMLHLDESWPRAIPFADLEVAARARIAVSPVVVHDPVVYERERREWLGDLLQLVATGLVQPHSFAPDVTTEVSAYPTASRWARWTAAA